MKKISIFTLIIFCIIFTVNNKNAFSCGRCPPVQSSHDIVADVNGVKIKKGDFVKKLKRIHGRQVLERMINNELLLQEAKIIGITVTDGEVKRREDEMVRNNYRTRQEFENVLKENNITIDEFRDDVKMNIVVHKLIEIGISEREIREHYLQNKERFGEPESVRASHILVRTEKEGIEILKELRKGADFVKIAREKSLCPSKDRGGDLGYFARGRMVPEFDKAAFELKVGEISDLVKTEFGYHIIKVNDRRPLQIRRFDEVRDNAKLNYMAENWQELSERLIRNLRDKARIKINL